MKKLSIIFSLILTSYVLHSQVKVKVCNNTDFTPENLIINDFLGHGVEVLNVKYIGKEFSTGKFSNIGDVIGIDRGIIMTTGKASMASLPNSNEKHTSYSSGLGIDSDLSKAAETNAPLYDICTFEITFKPFSDSLSFDYVFASNEYPEFSCDSFNDVFGFFISGPNPDGGIYDYENIALIPNTDSAVSIHNIHPVYDDPNSGKPYCDQDHEQYYNPLLQSQQNKMFYDGYINIFSAEAKVVPCQEYKIKISIADVADKTHDSAVFLKAKSFSTNVLKTDLITMSHDSTIAESCGNARLVFQFNNPVQKKYDLKLRLLTDNTLGQIATYGVDYNTNFNLITSINKGQQSATINFSAIEDNIKEDEEYIIIEYQRDLCNKDTFILKIVDNELSNIVMEDSIKVCSGDTVNIGASLSNDGNSSKDKYFYNSNDFIIPKEANSTIISPINVSGIYPSDIQLWKLKEICIDTLIATVLTDLDIYLISPLPDTIHLELSTDNGFKNGDSADIDSMISTCFTPTATIPINNGNSVQGDFNPLRPKYTGNYKPEGYFDDLVGKQANGIWKLQVTNDQTGFSSILKSWHISFKSNYTIDYKWTPNTNISCVDCLSPDIYPISNTNYKISLTDSYGCNSSDSIKAIITEKETIPYVDCDSISTDFIRIKWGIKTLGETYEIKVDNGDWQTVSDNIFSVSGLDFSQTVEFEIRIKGTDCVNPSFLHKCTTYKCPAPTVITNFLFNNNCFADSNAIIKINASGTVYPYIYKYHNIENTTGIFTNLPTGTDTIFVTDGNQCTIPYVFTIKSPPKIGVDFSIDEIKCHNDENANITANGYGGKGILQYKWRDSISNAIISYTNKVTNIGQGKYYLTIKDKNKCVYEDSVILSNPEPLFIGEIVENITCKGESTGKITLDIQGGNPPYTFHWKTPLGESDIKDLLNIPTGQYFVTVTDINECQAIKSFSINEPQDGLDVKYIANDSLCYGEKNGSIELLIPPNNDYEIVWSNGATGTSANNLLPGHYEITVTDIGIGCQKIIKEDIVELDSLTMELEQLSASCHDYEDGTAWVNKIFYGSRETNFSGFNFKWSTNPPQTKQFAYNLKGGRDYSVTITNNFGCTSTESISIGNPQMIQIKEEVKKDISCFGLNDGYLKVNNSGGNNSFSYKWSTGDSGLPYIDSLSSGIYTLTVTDQKGCKQEALFYIKEPEPISINFDNKDVSCYGGSDGTSTPIINGGSAPYLIYWQGEGEKLERVPAGKYFILIKDLNGCEKIDSTIIKEPKDRLSSIVETEDPKCYTGFNGKIHFTNFGGTPPYSHKVLKDKFFTGDELIGLKAGKYTVVTKDINNCTDTLRNIVISNPKEIIVDLGNDTIVDYNTKLTIKPKVYNVINPLTYKWQIPTGINSRCDNCYDQEIEVLYSILIKLEVIDSLECRGVGEKNISVKLDNSIFVPDAFRPASDIPSNKKLFVYGKEGIQVISFRIFNSWGGEVYHRNNFNINDESEGWDGTFKGVKLNSGTYIWSLEVKNINGLVQTYKGISTLLR